MKILSGTRPLQDIEVHLTDFEARELLEAIADCRHDLAEVGMSESHVPLSDRKSELMFFVYRAADELEAAVAERMNPHQL
jgi:hypothetical protein